MILNDKKIVLVSPLNWGLGHATRLIPIIRHYVNGGDTVVLAGYGQSYELLKAEFPTLEASYLPGFNVQYSRAGNHLFKMMLQLPSFFYWMWKEHRLLKQLIDEYKPYLIISDNRYGLYSSTVSTVIITHQLKLFLPPQLRLVEKMIQYKLKKWIERFGECWIPDNVGHYSLTTSMSQVDNPPNNIRFIGLLSRFDQANTVAIGEVDVLTHCDVVAVVSGPEPQREIFLKLLMHQLCQLPYRCLLVTGDLSNKKNTSVKNITIVGHLSAQMMRYYIEKSTLVICRSGYSSIMDLISLNKKAILVPTPGQREQEILANRLLQMNTFYCVNQADLELTIDVGLALNMSFNVSSFSYFPLVVTPLILA